MIPKILQFHDVHLILQDELHLQLQNQADADLFSIKKQVHKQLIVRWGKSTEEFVLQTAFKYIGIYWTIFISIGNTKSKDAESR